MAVAAADRGARVLLASANVEGDVLAEARRPGIEISSAGSAAELSGAISQLAAQADVVIMAAAVADYRVAEVSEGKLTKESGEVPTITLTENPDIVAGLASRPAGGWPAGRARAVWRDGALAVHAGLSLCPGVPAGADELPATAVGRIAGLSGVRACPRYAGPDRHDDCRGVRGHHRDPHPARTGQTVGLGRGQIAGLHCFIAEGAVPAGRWSLPDR